MSRLQGSPRVQDLYQNRSPEVVRYDRYTLASTRKSLLRQFPGQQWEEVALRWLVSPQNVGQSESGTTYRIGSNDFVGTANGLIPRALSGVGLAMGQVIALPGFDAIKQALPMIQALLEMMVIIVIPVLLMFSAYEPKSVVTISFAFFALMFLTFWWELAGWLDDRLITILYTGLSEQGMGSSIPLEDFVSSTYDGWLMNLVLGMMYLVFPAFWVGMMSWVGVNLGNAVSSALSNGSQQAKTHASEAGQLALNQTVGKIKGK
ncbi:conjugal transfer protein TraG N-terminal domain-containing protein [Citrobacter koseri]|uniref:conjugal transfer protein TraG N-terminal domain-containing protein n=1 Tax=Citrobacter koseri TaxID=545 RepID=UPI00388E9467